MNKQNEMIFNIKNGHQMLNGRMSYWKESFGFSIENAAKREEEVKMK